MARQLNKCFMKTPGKRHQFTYTESILYDGYLLNIQGLIFLGASL